jgi:hypothetical protein
MNNKGAFSPSLVLVLSVIGVGITELSVQYSLYYWATVFVVICALFSYEGARNDKENGSSQISHHVMHWFGALVALSLVFLFVYTGAINQGQAGLFAVLLLAFATFSDGLRVGPRYVLVGVYLFITAGVMAYVEEFLWWFLLLSFLAIGFEVYWLRRASNAAKDKGLSESA